MLVIATEMGTNSYHKNVNNNGTVELVTAADMEAPSMRHGIKVRGPIAWPDPPCKALSVTTMWLFLVYKISRVEPVSYFKCQ